MKLSLFGRRRSRLAKIQAVVLDIRAALLMARFAIRHGLRTGR